MNAIQLNLFTECAHAPIYAPTPIDLFTKRVDQSMRLITSYSKWKPLTLAYSGGKDSDCVRQLCKLAHVPISIVHNSTTIDPPGTLEYCIKHGAVVQRPKYTFFELVRKHGLPSMFRRFCCRYLKEQYVASPLLLGIRSDESQKRSKRYKSPSVCRIYAHNKRCEQVLPLQLWTLETERIFIEDNNMILHPHYYKNGKLDVTRRVGCVGCPLQGDRGVSDYLQYPLFLRQLVKSYAYYVKSHKAINGIYDDVLWQLFYSNHGDKKWSQTFHGLFDAPNPKEFLENYFNISLNI